MTGGLEMAYTDFLQLVQARQSDRSYDKERPVEPEKLERVLEAARLAPSACNAQPWRFVVITDKELAQKAGKAAAGLGMNKFAKDAPVHILVVEESANITSLLDIVIGYPAKEKRKKIRKPKEKVISYNRY